MFDTKKFAKFPMGGALEGNPHSEGGIPIEAEGGEFIIKKDSVNPATMSMIEYINEHGDLPINDARNRKEVL